MRTAAFVLLLALCHCGDSATRAVVGIAVSGLPAGAVTLVAHPTLNGSALGPQEFQADLGQLGFRASPGFLLVDLEALDKDRCVLGRGHGEIVMARAQRYDLAIAIAALPAPECGARKVQLTVDRTGEGTGTIVSDPPGIACGATCSAGFAQGATVRLTVTPDKTARFLNWSGACTGTGACQATLGTEGAHVGADFSRKVCSADGWCWENPLPQGNVLTSIWGSTSKDIWAVGNGGTIVHWNGSAWSGSPSGTTRHLDHVWGTAANDIWAVGEGGTLRYPLKMTTVERNADLPGLG